MRRRVLALDRFAAVVAGLVLLALGLGVAAWGAGQLDRAWAGAPSQLSTGVASDVYGQPWWGWASGAVGVLLLVLGLWWLTAHVPRRGAKPLRLPGSDRRGALSLDGGSAAAVAGEVVADLPGVRSASGRMVHERGRLIAVIDVTARPSTDLGELSAELDRVSADLRAVLGRDDVRCRVRVRVARHGQDVARVL